MMMIVLDLYNGRPNNRDDEGTTAVIVMAVISRKRIRC